MEKNLESFPSLSSVEGLLVEKIFLMMSCLKTIQMM